MNVESNPGFSPKELVAHGLDEGRIDSIIRAYIPASITVVTTRKCNLRCLYCSTSGKFSDPDTHKDMSREYLKKIIRIIAPLRKRIKEVWFSGGEITFRDDWIDISKDFLAAGFRSSAHMNMTRMLSPAEIEAAAQFAALRISIDSADPSIMKAVRLKSRIEVIAYNVLRLRAFALDRGLRLPDLGANAVMTEQSFSSLPELPGFLHAMGIGMLGLTDVSEMEGVDTGTRSVLHFEKFSQSECLRILDETGRNAARYGMEFQIDPAITQALNGYKAHGIQSGMTRDCLDPWGFLVFSDNGEIHTCCAGYPPIAHLDEVESLSDIFLSKKNLQCKGEIMTGALAKECAGCARKGAVEPTQFHRHFKQSR